MPAIDWPHLLGFTVSPIELFIRGTLTYMLLFCMFRFVVHRDVGALGVTDLLVLVIIADASQNAMAGEYRSLPDGLVLIGTIIGWNFLLNYLSFYFEAVRRFTLPRPLCLVRDGKKLAHNLRRELIADEELREMLREHEIVDLAQVRRAYLEPDGQLTVIRNRSAGNVSVEHTSASGQTREIHMAHANPIQIQKYLKGVDYPADKQTLIDTARQQGADESVCASLDQLPDEQFQTPADVSAAFKGPSQDHAERANAESGESGKAGEAGESGDSGGGGKGGGGGPRRDH